MLKLNYPLAHINNPLLKTFFCLLLIFIGIPSFAQKKFTISGNIKDAATGEVLIGATVRIKELSQNGAASNNYGFYSLSAPEGDYTLLISYVGYVTVSRQVSLHKNVALDIILNARNDLTEVVVSAKGHNNDNVTSPEMGVEKLNMSQINNVPVLLGERDILKTISLLPGVKAASEGNTGFYVRGGASDQNLILLDEAIVYNASHLFGFFSTFNSDAIKDVSLYKGGMPAQYGGRLSSVLDIKMDEGNNKEYVVEGGIGLISSRIKLEGPIVKDKGSFMISARRTYIDAFLKASSDSTVKGSKLYFYDLNAKANYHFDDKNAIYLSGYFGKDVLGLRNTFGTNWGNATGTLRFNHVFNSKLFSNTSLVYSNYNYTIQSFLPGNDFRAVSKITDIDLKEDLQYYINSNHTLRFGIDALHHNLAPGSLTSNDSSSFNTKVIQRRYGLETAAYVSDEWHVNDKLTLLYGARLSGIFIFGPGTFSTYNADGNTLSSKTYQSGDVVKSYFYLEPRLSASYSLNDQTSLKASYNRNTQNIHILSNSNSSTPTDLYAMSSNNIKPEIADQVSTGYFRNFDENIFEFSTEVYYKWLQNQIDYKDGAQLILNQDVESQLVYGTGRAYGIEFYLKKKYGRFNGWLGYTLSRTERKFDAINNGNYFPATQDRTHDISAVGIYQLNKRWSFSSTFVYGTGNAVTYPNGKYAIGGVTTYYYSQRNANREPSNNRLDIGATFEGKPHKKYHSSWTFGIYNIYNHRNPYAITFRDSKTNPGTTEAVETSLFGRVPSVTWNFKF
ncbi:TonB-dependent Receptor Plug Domain [Mucilaginibacter mallensis]|uniref:TonB-dependent Receptor Plug Domain n=1 Tax=Mucilaginibacter mallensis TaxID=652787 RepID=A0A1H2A2B8_MUCMA|nr:TonB-dependent receptor [Mucilaginibacter mallensis]SDT40050.1 TonB-dependent Receptor Plug Domain [Mucilaginibacter mallensis]